MIFSLGEACQVSFHPSRHFLSVSFSRPEKPLQGSSSLSGCLSALTCSGPIAPPVVRCWEFFNGRADNDGIKKGEETCRHAPCSGPIQTSSAVTRLYGRMPFPIPILQLFGLANSDAIQDEREMAIGQIVLIRCSVYVVKAFPEKKPPLARGPDSAT